MQMLDEKPYIEYIDGRPFPKVSPKRAHSAVQLAFGTILLRCAAGRGFVGPELRVHLDPATTLVPDVAYVSYDRLRGLSDEEAQEPPFAPDIAVEVRSPSDSGSMIASKTRKYLAHGSLLVINADPSTRTMTAHFGDGSARHHNEGDHFECAAFPWLCFEVREAFSLIDIPR